MEVPLDVAVPVLPSTPRRQGPLQCRCMVHKLGCLVQVLSEQKKAAMRAFGFGGLLEAAAYSLRMALIEDLVACFDPDTATLSVHGRVLQMTAEHAGSLLGLPTGGTDVDDSIRQDGVTEERLRIARDSLTPSALYAEIVQLPHGEEFKGKLLLYIISTILRPTSNVHISTVYLSLLTMLDDIRNLNWAEHAFQGMLAAVRIYRCGQARRVANKRIGGCIWLLQLFYLEHLAVGIIHKPILDRQTPRVSFWTETLISRAVKVVHQRGGVGAHTIGMFSSSGGISRGSEQEIYSLRREITVLQRELASLRAHVELRLTDLRREVGDMIHGQLQNVRSEAVAVVREELAATRSELADMRKMLQEYMARVPDATTPDAGTSKDHQENERTNVSQDHREVAASPILLSSEGVIPTAELIPEVGVKQEMRGLHIRRCRRRKKEHMPQGIAAEAKQDRVISPIIDSINYPLRQHEAGNRRDILRSSTQRIPGVKRPRVCTSGSQGRTNRNN